MFFITLLASVIFITPKNDTVIHRTSLIPTPVASSVNRTLLLQLVNDARQKGCKCGSAWYGSAAPLSWNDVLEKAAFNHSTDMNGKGFFSHTSSTGMGAGPRLTAIGYNWKAYGENIAQGYTDEREVVAGWLKSPGHCANIMNKDYREMGVANVNGYWTQDFGAKN